MPRWRKALKLAPVVCKLGPLHLSLQRRTGFHLLDHVSLPLQSSSVYSYQLITYHILLGLTLWSYFAAWSTPPGSPDGGDVGDRLARGDEEDGIGLMDMLNGERGRAGAREGLLTDGETEGGSSGAVMAKSTNGGKRFCRKCSVLKPDRSV
jgi:hypothetical protein